MTVAYASLGRKIECGGFVSSWLSGGGSLKGRYMLSCWIVLCGPTFKVLILKHLFKK